MIYKIKGTNKKGQDLDTKVKLTQCELNNIINQLYKKAVEPIPEDELTSFYMYCYSEDDEWNETQKIRRESINQTLSKHNTTEEIKK